MMLKQFFDIYWFQIFKTAVRQCAVHSCSCPWLKLQHSDWRANLVKDFFEKKIPPMRALKFITGYVIYNPAYNYKFQLKTTKINVPKCLQCISSSSPSPNQRKKLYRMFIFCVIRSCISNFHFLSNRVKTIKSGRTVPLVIWRWHENKKFSEILLPLLAKLK